MPRFRVVGKAVYEEQWRATAVLAVVDLAAIVGHEDILARAGGRIDCCSGYDWGQKQKSRSAGKELCEHRISFAPDDCISQRRSLYLQLVACH